MQTPVNKGRQQIISEQSKTRKFVSYKEKKWGVLKGSLQSIEETYRTWSDKKKERNHIKQA